MGFIKMKQNNINEEYYVNVRDLMHLPRPRRKKGYVEVDDEVLEVIIF